MTGCFAGAASAAIIGAAVRGSDRNDPRQMTFSEAGGAVAGGCPLFIPFAMIYNATCPDNAGTVEVARLAHYYTQKPWIKSQIQYLGTGYFMGQFTAEMGKACKSGRVTPGFAAKLGLKHSRFYAPYAAMARARHVPVHRHQVRHERVRVHLK